MINLSDCVKIHIKHAANIRGSPYLKVFFTKILSHLNNVCVKKNCLSKKIITVNVKIRLIETKIKYSSNIIWDMNQNPYTVIPVDELEKSVTIFLKYDIAPKTVLFNLYPTLSNGSSSLVESVEFGISFN